MLETSQKQNVFEARPLQTMFSGTGSVFTIHCGCVQRLGSQLCQTVPRCDIREALQAKDRTSLLQTLRSLVHDFFSALGFSAFGFADQETTFKQYTVAA